MFANRGTLRHIAHLPQQCHNSEFGVFELLVQKETFAHAFVTGIVSDVWLAVHRNSVWIRKTN